MVLFYFVVQKPTTKSMILLNKTSFHGLRKRLQCYLVLCGKKVFCTIIDFCCMNIQQNEQVILFLIYIILILSIQQYCKSKVVVYFVVPNEAPVQQCNIGIMRTYSCTSKQKVKNVAFQQFHASPCLVKIFQLNILTNKLTICTEYRNRKILFQSCVPINAFVYYSNSNNRI